MLTRPRRQILATLALIGFTVLPSAYVGYTAHRVGRPSHLREVEDEIGRRLGVLVKVATASHPRPDQDVLEGVSLRLDASPRSEIAHADSLRLTRGKRELTLKVGTLHLRGGEAANVLHQVTTIMRRLTSSDETQIALVADRAEIAFGGKPQTVYDLAAILKTSREHPTLTASYLIAGDANAPRTRCEMILSQSAGPEGIRTSVTMKTLDGAIDARLLSPFFDPESWLGSLAKMDGTITLERREGHDWVAEFRGMFENVDLSSIVGHRFAGHRLSGKGRIAIEKARWADRGAGQGTGWIEARGTLLSGPGTISVGLLRALESRMHFRLGSPIDPEKRDLAFQALGLTFAMDAQGDLKITGALGHEYMPDAVFVQGNRPLPLARAPEGLASVRGLWNTLIPATVEVMAPAVSEANVLRSLPLPSSRPGPLSAN